MTAAAAAPTADVLAVLDRAQNALGIAGFSGPANEVIAARDTVSELIAAVIENRSATQAFANDGQPANWTRYEVSERRLEAALAKAGA